MCARKNVRYAHMVAVAVAGGGGRGRAKCLHCHAEGQTLLIFILAWILAQGTRQFRWAAGKLHGNEKSDTLQL